MARGVKGTGAGAADGEKVKREYKPDRKLFIFYTTSADGSFEVVDVMGDKRKAFDKYLELQSEGSAIKLYKYDVDKKPEVAAVLDGSVEDAA